MFKLLFKVAAVATGVAVAVKVIQHYELIARATVLADKALTKFNEKFEAHFAEEDATSDEYPEAAYKAAYGPEATS